MEIIENSVFDEERALYGLRGATVRNCVFDGPADGESALKECCDIIAESCVFRLRYPLWHAENFELKGSEMTVGCRAALWYCRGGNISDTEMNGIKALRECTGITLRNVRADSPEFGWKCNNTVIDDSEINSEYFMFESCESRIHNLKMTGKYSFQYTKNFEITDCILDTKDAFWHAENIMIKDSVVKGEYLGWYSNGLTFINCRIIGTQPLCYCKNLKLVNCTMEDTDLSFEYSDVSADIKGEIMSVKNPHSGIITADGYGEIITENSVMENNCKITVRNS